MTALRCRKKRPLWSASFITGTPIEYKKHKHSTGLFTFSPPEATSVMFLPHEVREFIKRHKALTNTTRGGRRAHDPKTTALGFCCWRMSHHPRCATHRSAARGGARNPLQNSPHSSDLVGGVRQRRNCALTRLVLVYRPPSVGVAVPGT